MVFSSPIFIFLFLPITIALYFSFKKMQARNTVLLLMSLFFYAWGEGKFFVVMLASVALNYWFGMKMTDLEKSPKKRAWLTFSVSINLLILIYFKYFGFLVSNLNNLLVKFHHAPVSAQDVHLPAGVSFFTFHALSYLIDVYRGHFKAQRNPINLGLYIALFPQLIAGPIVRYEQIGPSLDKRETRIDDFCYGIQRFIIGLSKKVLLADAFSPMVEKIFALHPHELSAPLAWVGIVFYTFQIYFDFSGYSDMAIGMAKIFGFTFLENFNYPYIANSITDFWRRWHISLSSWFRDYLYIPLGGNRVGAFRQYFNLFLVFFLCGLWHGASWSFVVWGLFHGSLLVIDKLFLLDVFKRTPKIFNHLYVILMVIVSWVFFRAENLNYAVHYLGVMFGFEHGTGVAIPLEFIFTMHICLILAVSFIAATPVTRYLRIRFFGNPYMIEESEGWRVSMLLAACFLFIMFFFCLSSVADNTFNPFIYYRF